MPATVTFADIEAAAERLRGVAHRTPVFTSRTFDKRFRAQFFFKCENFQRAGAFKFRGAYNALSRLDPEARRNGVLTYSSGNHAQALAVAGSILGVSTTIIMPSDAPAVKLEATRQYGADVITYDRSETTREELGAEISSARGLPIIPPYDHPDVVAGQGTAAMELLEQVGSSSSDDHAGRDGGAFNTDGLDLLLVCCGGGGLLSGSAIVTKELQPACRVIGVEPERADDATQSFKTGKLHTIHNPVTIADGARTPSLGKITFPLVLEHVDEMVTASESSIVKAMHFLWQRIKVIVEPTGALAPAALFEHPIAELTPDFAHPERTARVGVILSGGNVEISKAAKLFATYGLE